MMIYGDKKRLLSAVLGPSGEEIRPEETPDSPDELSVVARELIDAVHAKDTAAVVDCLRAAFGCLEMDETSEEE